MSLKDRLANLKVDQVKDLAQQGLERARAAEQKAEASEAGQKAIDRVGKLGEAAKERFGKK